ncbi:phosphate ABC transporter substrate-binding protein, PhoT family [Bryocella elongata]|uniref:Phosphate-binding protein n=1 Tax=Bryocella elongata TaxID=863522 RepID=A0A1H5YI80_9BACT|nr:phosphate ABC transporter substrate-binding protein PstS [Bryocella elongata]SEG23315.1 phosphate ABC transporter substrate-binding protein, PhoT family [Bryocella elongata]
MKFNLYAAALLASVLATGASIQAQNLTGAGATFPNPIYSRWFSEYAQEHPGVHINYQSVGSGAGIQQVSKKVVDFGASDAILTDQQLKDSQVKLTLIPTVLGAVVPVYNVPGVGSDLKFSGDVIADIYLGKITNWNDGRIKADNPGVNFPDKRILPVYRAEGSGTNFIFTDYLSKVNPEFKTRVGAAASVHWPLGIGAKGNEGVAGMIRNTPGSFGYVELIYAVQNKMSYGDVKNAAGKYVKASTDSVSAAAAASAKVIPSDYRISITNATGAGSYPISSFTWLLIPNPSPDSAKGKVLHDFLVWMLEKGQSEAAGMTYAPLPKNVADKVRATINTVK